MKKKLLLALLTITSLCAIDAMATTVLGTGFTYQGRLNDGGTPANGTYDFAFALFDAPTNGVIVGAAAYAIATPVTNGLFTVQLNANNEFGPTAFNGSARWLEIYSRTNNNSLNNPLVMLLPRQSLAAAPHALFAQTAQSAQSAQTATTALSAATVTDGAITSSKLAAGAVTWSAISGIPAGFADGIDNDTTYSAGPGLGLSGGNQFSVNFGGTGNATSAARSDHNHFGASWSGSSSSFGLVIANSSTTGSGVYSQQGSGSGAIPALGYKAAVWGEASQGDGVYGATGSATGTGVYGLAAATGGANYGVYGESDSPNGVGVFARGSGTTGTALKIHNGAIRVANAGINTATPAFVHSVTQASLVHNYAYYSIIDNPYCNNDPDAVLLITPNWSGPSSSPLAGVQYDDGTYGIATNRWVIVCLDYNNYIGVGDRYNILVIKP